MESGGEPTRYVVIWQASTGIRIEDIEATTAEEAALQAWRADDGIGGAYRVIPADGSEPTRTFRFEIGS